jgi:hypothetical protein
MKKYFAKYLPVEGEIKKVKLFLCSRNIEVGDKYYYNGTETDICDSEIRLEQIKEQEEKHGQKRFKVIGEISPEAIWVKEGDEFNEVDVRGRLIYFDAFGEASSYHKSVQESIIYKKYDIDDPGSKRGMFFKYIQIKCKCCNTFK